MIPVLTEPASRLAELPVGVDRHPIEEHLAALSPPFDVDDWVIPLPVWALRGFDDGPAAAWRTVREDLTRARSANPMCIYVHVPFCSAKCDFCDCYSFAVRSNVDTTMERYLDALCGELATWSEVSALAARPVSTVHLGGGTPTYLGPARLRRVVERIRSCFTLASDTELALETTVSSLTPDMVETMDDLGITRVHVGVQSLDDDVRRLIGRRSPAATVRREIDAGLARGWIVSVDLVCGLPRQDATSFVDDIRSLVTAGVDGFSLYELLVYPQNQVWAERQGIAARGRDHLPNYLMFLAGAQALEAAGYRTNTFNHWAGPRDRNVYFTFPTRGEDCLAVGPIADGVFGDYHYRHPRHASYLRGARQDGVGLHGGLRRTARESALHPLVSAILSSRIPPTEVRMMDEACPDGPITPGWRVRRLVQSDHDIDGGLVLSASGSWFAGNMVRELAQRYRT